MKLNKQGRQRVLDWLRTQSSTEELSFGPNDFEESVVISKKDAMFLTEKLHEEIFLRKRFDLYGVFIRIKTLISMRTKYDNRFDTS